MTKTTNELRNQYLERAKLYPASHPVYQMDEKGTYLIYGEDPNPDLFGSHHEPFLGVYEGTFSDVLTAAVSHPSFWQWGAGGRIVKTNVFSAESVNTKTVTDQHLADTFRLLDLDTLHILYGWYLVYDNEAGETGFGEVIAQIIREVIAEKGK